MIYRQPFYRRVLLASSGALFIIISIALAIYMAADTRPSSPGEIRFALLFPAAMLLSGIALVVSARRFQLTLTPRELVLRRAFYTRTILRKDISRTVILSIAGGGSNQTVVLYSPGKRLPRMSFPLVFADNPGVRRWLEDIR